MNRQEIGHLLHILLGNYPNTKITDAGATISAWELELAEYEAEDVYKAARLHMNRSKFFPSVAEIKPLIPLAKIVYAPQPQKKQIEASKKCYLAEELDLSYLFEEDKPSECCYKCQKFNYCYGDN